MERKVVQQVQIPRDTWKMFFLKVRAATQVTQFMNGMITFEDKLMLF